MQAGWQPGRIEAHVQAHPHHSILDLGSLQAELGKDAANLAPSDQQVVRPLESGAQTGL